MASRRIPGNAWLDSTLSLLREGYPFISRRCTGYGSPVFQTRLMGQRTLCLYGAEAAKLFYDPRRFMRTSTSTPAPLRNILLGSGGVQGLDGAPHAHRKQLFLGILSLERAQVLVDAFAHAWEKKTRALSSDQPLAFLPWVEELLCASVTAWAGVPALATPQAQALTRRLAALIDGAGRMDLRLPLAWFRRKACEAQAARWLGACREGRMSAPEGSALALLACHRDEHGQLLPLKVAAVELLNILRPVVAVGRFLLFGIIELGRRPEWRSRLQADPSAARAFAEEVRRYYAFFPMVGAYVREDFEWQGYEFKKGTRALFDLFGTNRDPGRWPSPEKFEPEQVETSLAEAPAGFAKGCPIAQGIFSQGGADYTYHRCPGEPLTLMLMERSFLLLTRQMQWSMGRAEVDFSRLPMLPRHTVSINNVKWVEQ